MVIRCREREGEGGRGGGRGGRGRGGEGERGGEKGEGEGKRGRGGGGKILNRILGKHYYNHNIHLFYNIYSTLSYIIVSS